MLEDELLIEEDSDLQEEEEISGEILLDTEDALTEEDNNLFVTNEIQEINDTPVDFDTYYDLVEDSSESDNINDGQLHNEIHDIPFNMETLSDSENVNEERENDNSDSILESLLVSQQNIKTGFDNLSLISSVQLGITSFAVGAIIIYCFIGKIR